MPRGRKRKDPDAAPIDGDYSLDQVINKRPDMAYAGVHRDDLPRFQALGYVAETRGEDAAKPAWDQGGVNDPGYMIRDLVLMKVPTSIKERREKADLAVAQRRMEAMKRTFEGAGGVFAVPQNNF
jgi:hypothetical protein